MTIDFEATKEKLTSKSDELRDLRGKVDGIIAEKSKFEAEAKKSTEGLEKTKE